MGCVTEGLCQTRLLAAAMKLAYTLAMPDPASHLFVVTLDITSPPSGALRVALPAWAPGSYLVRDFARNVQDFGASDARGRALAWRRVDKSSWEVDVPPRGGRVRVRYAVWANELSVRTSHLDATHGFVSGPDVFAYVVGAKELPASLVVRPFRGWRVDTSLERRGRNVFVAPDYDALIDAPLEIGTHRTLRFTARGKPHRVVLYGRGNEDAVRIVADLKRIVEEEAAIWGGLPYREYVFIVHLSDKAAGGLEHRGSNVSGMERWSFQPGKKYEDFLALEAHEFFHCWNVKRLRPLVLGPFDYSREVHTSLLWAMEGITSYYDHLVLVRSGIISEDRYREFVAETISKLREQPGRFKVSLSQSSFLTWIKLYKPDANSVNSSVSYYLKGELVAMCLDLAIRDRTRGRKSLDDVLRALYARYPFEGPGVPELHAGGRDGWREALEDVTGLSWRAFWAKYIDGTHEVDFESFLRKVGWEVRPTLRSDDADEKLRKGEYAGPGAWLGLEAKESDRRLRVASVLVGSPALAAGVSPEDELVALDGYQLRDKESLEKRLREREPGDRIALHVFRRGELVALDVSLGENPPEKWNVREKKGANARAKRLRAEWLESLAPRSRSRGQRPVVSEGRPRKRVPRRE